MAAKATWATVRRLALALPGTSERESEGRAQWRVGDKLFVWERPLRPSDLLALGKRAPKRLARQYLEARTGKR